MSATSLHISFRTGFDIVMRGGSGAASIFLLRLSSAQLVEPRETINPIFEAWGLFSLQRERNRGLSQRVGRGHGKRLHAL